MLDTTETTVKTVGQSLRQARMELGLTLKDLAAVTKIQASLLQHLEDDQFDEFPAEVFARGFLKNYARELRLDVDSVLSQYHAQRGTNGPVKVTVVEEASEPVAETAVTRNDGKYAETSNVGRLAYAGAIVALVIGLVLTVLMFSNTDTQATSTANFQPTDYSDSWRPAPEGQDDWRTYREN